MKKSAKKIEKVNDYILTFPKEVQVLLKKLREVIKSAAPKAEEKMAYGIPTFTLNGNLVHFGGFKNHIGFFPTPSAITKFKKELAKYKVSKGTVQFSLDKKLPVGLIKKIVAFRVKQNSTKKPK
jgi:uncharacterized protein YdhG (YjbR/CyaY superfamily)